MSWLDGLSTALTAGTKGASGWLEGQQRGRREADDRAKELVAALRQKRIDEQNDLMRTYQISGLKRQEEAAGREPAERAELESLLVAARGGDAAAIAKVIARRPDLADEFRPAKVTTPDHIPGNALIPDGKGGWKKADPNYRDPASAVDKLIQSQAFSAHQSAKGAYDQTLSRRPDARKPVMVDTEKGFVEDAMATADKRSAFSADSTAKAQDVQDTFAAARSVGAPVQLPSAVLTPAQTQAKAAIAAINASTSLSPGDKLKRIAGVKAKLASLSKK